MGWSKKSLSHLCLCPLLCPSHLQPFLKATDGASFLCTHLEAISTYTAKHRYLTFVLPMVHIVQHNIHAVITSFLIL